ncbi:MAG: hypothetical protein HOQ28_07430 [Thermoleophilia bacterium]|nr:hypothetical protein [Thermoleophilia bacterium]
MNIFLWAASALLALELPLLAYAFFAAPLDALVALQAAGGIWCVSLVVLAQGFERSAYTILAVVAALLTFGSGMIFVRFFDDEIDA